MPTAALAAPALPDWRTADPTSPVVAALLADPGYAAPIGADCDEPIDRQILYDFCLMPYAAQPNPRRRAQSVVALQHSFSLMNVGAEGRALVERLIAVLGPQCTVWGVKNRPGSDDLWWEFYFYRRDHVPPQLSLDLVRPAFAPMVIDAQPPADMAWTFFSLEVTVAHLRCERPLHVRLYQEGVDLSWSVRGRHLELENHYRHFEVDGQTPQLLAALATSVHAPRHPRTLARLIPPQLHQAWRIWLARKRNGDTIYFQRVHVAQVAWLMRRHRWPLAFAQWFEAAAPFLQHVQFDLGVEFARSDTSIDGEPPITFGKTGVYATF